MKSSELNVLPPTPSGRAAEACESCGGEFECGAAAPGCWCAGVSLGEAERTELRGRFRGCLCRACLEGYAERVRPGAGGEDV